MDLHALPAALDFKEVPLAPLVNAKRSLLICCALGAAAVAGWGSFAYAALSSAQRLSAMTAERDAAFAEHKRLQAAAGQLSELETKIGSARVEYGRVVQGWAEVKARIGSAQQELAAVTKRLDEASDRVRQTGSLRQPEPPKRAVR